jgi:endogenous inhibitor of DNA gyrase (YacG/DUF329 family)
MTRPCPQCQKPAELAPSNPDRPFCSKRCRELDLKGWLDEDYVVPGEAVDLDDEQGGGPRPERDRQE